MDRRRSIYNNPLSAHGVCHLVGRQIASNAYSMVTHGTSGCLINSPTDSDTSGTTSIRAFHPFPAFPPPPTDGNGARRGVPL